MIKGKLDLTFNFLPDVTFALYQVIKQTVLSHVVQYNLRGKA